VAPPVMKYAPNSKVDTDARRTVQRLVAKIKSSTDELYEQSRLVFVITAPEIHAPGAEVGLVSCDVKLLPSDDGATADTAIRMSGGLRSFRGKDVLPNIEVSIGLVNESWTLSALTFRLYDLVRHELEHARQHSSGAMTYEYEGAHAAWDVPKSVVDYYLDPLEVEAHVMGQHMYAKKKHFALRNVLAIKAQRLKMNMVHSRVPKREAEDVAARILGAWIAYAELRVPKAM